MQAVEKKNYLFSNTDLRKLIVPLVFEQILAITVGMADTMMISSVGEAAVSGVSLVDMLNNLIFSVLSALATGGAVVCSQFLGAGKEKEACKAAKQLLFTGLAVGCGMVIFVVLFRDGLLDLFFGSIEQDVWDAAMTYMLVSAVSFPFLGIYNSCSALFRAMGKANVTFWVSVVGNVINVVGNAICIFGLHMGVAGVAIPSTLSRAFMGLALYALLKNPKQAIHFKKEKFRLNTEIIKKILYIGIPSGIEGGIFQLGRVLVVSIISGFGTVQIAANGVANSLDSMGSVIGQAMNLAMITVIGRCVGAGDKKQIQYYAWKLVGIAYVATIAVNIPMLLSLNPILALYRLGEETTRLSHTLVMIHNGMAMVIWPLSFVLPNMLRASNDVRFPMITSIFSMCAFRVGFSYILGVMLGWGAIGVWVAMIFDWTFRSICFVGRYFHGDWKKTMYKLKE